MVTLVGQKHTIEKAIGFLRIVWINFPCGPYVVEKQKKLLTMNRIEIDREPKLGPLYKTRDP